MTVVRSTSEERRSWSLDPSRRGPAGRNREGVLLAAALAVVFFGVFLTYRAVSTPFGEIEEGLAAGRILNLNAVRQPEELLPFLTSFKNPVERSFVSQRIWRHLTSLGRPVNNVGELGILRVRASEMEEATWPTLGKRLEERRAQRPEQEDPSIHLLSPAVLGEMKPLLVVRGPGSFRKQLALWGLLAAATLIAAHLLWRWRGFTGDPMLLPITALLVGLGLIAMVSVWDPLRDLLYFRNFAQGVIFGSLLMVGVSLVDFERRFFRRLTFPALIASFALSILLILLGTGPGTSDAKVNLFGVQPIEGIKVLVVFFLAGYFFDHWEMLRELKERRGWFVRLEHLVRVPKLEYVLPPLEAMAVLLLLFFQQHDLGPALVLSLLFSCLYGVARGKPTMAIVALLVAFAGFALGYQLGVPRTVAGRITMWRSPWDNSISGGDHLAQSLWAFATGGATGTGLGLGQPATVPAIHTDMVLAVLGEELGFAGLLAVTCLFALLIWRCLSIADRAAGVYTYFLALGLLLIVALQFLLIAGGVVGLLPLSGVVTPFLSYGRSSMLASFTILGILLAISGRPGTGAATRRFHSSTALTGALLTAGLAVFLVRAAYLQVFRADHVLTRGTLTLQADGFRRFRYNPRLIEVARAIPRGSILDRNGVLLATNDPAELADQRQTYERLGVSFEPSADATRRLYPFGGKTFHLLGDLNTRVNWGARNTSFVERDSQVRLQGYDDYATVRTVRQPGGGEKTLVESDYRELIPLLRYRHRPGHTAVRRILERQRNVRLTVDVALQIRVAATLDRQVRKAEGKGAAVVIDAATGDLLASVSVPWPESQPVGSAAGVERLVDRARYGLYPPGSSFKIVSAMAALHKDPVIAAKTYPCVALDNGRVGHKVRGWGRPIRDDPTVHVAHGEVDLVKGIRLSCNAYFAQLVTYDVGAQQLLETAANLGITVAKPNTTEKLSDALPQAGYGQGQVTATPMEMARVAATVANGGLVPQVRWVIDDSNERNQPPVRIISEDQASLLARAMRQVVIDGSARQLRAVTPPVAGKTGTAQVADERSHSWFIGFVPAGQSERKLALAVLVEHGGYGGRAAAEAAGTIVGELADLGYFEEVPSDE